MIKDPLKIEFYQAVEFMKFMNQSKTEKDISQGDIARALEVDKSFVSNIENGKANPTLATITKLAKAIGVSVGKLMK